ncbi:MAG: response regulator [Clostridiaceae bacterium]
MIKVVIVDDEMLIRVGIKSCIDWEEHGFEIAGQAGNGLKALEIIEATHPDIVMTDIKMPKMDGLELISEVRKRFPSIKIIVLSCYNEIDFVKKAIKLGAEDYVLKLSLEPEILLEVLSKVKQLIQSEYRNDNTSRNTKNESRENQYIIKEDVYRKMISGSIRYEDFAKELSSLGICIDSGSNIVICCGIDDHSYAPVMSKMDDQYLFKFSVINILEESISSFANCDIAEVEEGEYIILLRRLKTSDELCSKDLITGYLKKINNSLKNYLNISISFGVNPEPIEYTRIRENYFKARAAMKYKFYYGRESIIFYNDIGEFDNRELLFTYSNEKSLLGRLEDFDELGVNAIINGFFNRISECKTSDPEKVRKVSLDIFHSLMKFAKKFDVKANFISDNFSVHPLDFLMTSETVSDIAVYFGEFINKLFEFIYCQQLEAKRPEIIKLQKYIAENISENITLDKASKISNISKCYLSSIFKKETGEVFVDYVNKAKMERAKTLIQENGLKSCEAAEKVGINDDSYFSKLFKKHIGVCPSKLLRINK